MDDVLIKVGRGFYLVYGWIWYIKLESLILDIILYDNNELILNFLFEIIYYV